MIVEDYSNSSMAIRVLDICTGSGCIAHSINKFLAKSVVYACDISCDALELADSQFRDKDSNLLGAVSFFKCDVLGSTAKSDIEQIVGKDIDIIVSNPPYICAQEKPLMKDNVLNYEPSIALFVSDDDPLIFYRVIAKLALALLCSGGRLYFEINERFGNELLYLMQDMGYINCSIIKDLNGKDRFALASKQ